MGVEYLIAAGILGAILLIRAKQPPLAPLPELPLYKPSPKPSPKLPPWPAEIPRTVTMSALEVQKAVNRWIRRGQQPGPVLVEDGKVGPKTLRAAQIWGQKVLAANPEWPWPMIIRQSSPLTMDIDTRLRDRIVVTLD